MRILLGLALVLVAPTLADEAAPVVRTHSGSIRGHWQVSQRGRKFQAYEGIPYAQPPVGELRFKPPQPIGTWVGQLSATQRASKCTQYGLVENDPAGRVSGSEDCLHLNVYTPVEQKSSSRRNTKLLPVIFYIHGGAFQVTAGSQNPHYLMNEDVVLVTINYRLGPLGFLSTGDAVVPGNMGLKDQNLALRWVAENIEAFGGDPKRVTLAGPSAGAVSVHYHYLSPMSRGLFQRGMSLSGSALNSWAQTENSPEKARELGALMGCPTSSSEQLVNCLRTRPAKSIVAQTKNFFGWRYNPYTPFGPVVDEHSDEPFITKSPIEIINSGEAADLPWITSIVAEEGFCPAAEFYKNEADVKELDKNWESIAPHILDYNYTIPSTEHARVARKIREHYLGNKAINKTTAKGWIPMLGDRLFVSDAEKAARIHAKVTKSPVRFYRFNHRGEFSLTNAFERSEDFGAAHGDDDSYLFYNTFGILSREEDLKMSENMVKLWTSYAATGVPDVGIEWPSINPSKKEFDYLHIKGPGQFSMESSTNLGENTFWSTIDFEENKLIGISQH